MKFSRIGIKFLRIASLTVLCAGAAVIFLTNQAITRLVDSNQNRLYSDKLQSLCCQLEGLTPAAAGVDTAGKPDVTNRAVESLLQCCQKETAGIHPFIIASDGRVILNPELPDEDRAEKESAGFQGMLTGRQGQFTLGDRRHGKWIIYQRFEPLDWVVAWSVPLNEKYREAVALRMYQTLLVGSVCLIALLVLVFFLLRMVRSVVSLTHAVSDIAAGRFDEPIDIESHDEVGELAQSFESMRDAIRRKLSELRGQQEFTQLVINSIPQYIFWKDRNSVYIGCNQNFAQVAGLKDVQSIVGKTDHDLAWKQEEADSFLKCDREVMEQDKAQCHIIEPQQHAGGKQALLDTNKIPLHGADGEVVGVLGTYEDITERRLMEEEKRELEAMLHQSEKMEAIGQLAGGVAHDFNNMLAGIMGAAQLLGEKLTEDQVESQSLVDLILSSVERAANLTAKLLAFGRKQPLLFTPTNMHEVLKETIDLLKSTIDKKIRLEVRLEAPQATVDGDPSLLQSVFLNLGINASHAMLNGGTLAVSTQNIEISDTDASLLRAGTYLEICVADTGAGIPADVLPRIFEPFFTTKEAGKGTGLGLAASHGTIHQHHGEIYVESIQGQGTTFRIVLPVCGARKKRKTSARTTPVAGHGTILLVEDEEVIRIVTKSMLELLGYHVMLADSAESAVEIYAQRGQSIDVVILDVIMPGMNGKECFSALKKMNPDLRAIMASGYSREQNLEEFTQLGIAGFIQKPFRKNDLAFLLEDVLRG